MNPDQNAEGVPDDEAFTEAAPLIYQTENETVVPPGPAQPYRRLSLLSTTFLMSVCKQFPVMETPAWNCSSH